MHSARLAEVEPHPVAGRERRGAVFMRVTCSDIFGRGFILSGPAQGVVIAAVTEVKEATQSGEELQRRFGLATHGGRQERSQLRPGMLVIESGNQRQPESTVV